MQAGGRAKDRKSQKSKGKEAVGWLVCDHKANIRVGIRNARGNKAIRDAHSAISLCLSPSITPSSPGGPLRGEGATYGAPTLTLQGKAVKWGWKGGWGLSPGRRSRRAPGGHPAAGGRSGDPGRPMRKVKRRSGERLAPPLPGRLRLLTFSVSRSFTVGNGVRADILCGRRGRAGVSRAGLRAPGASGRGCGRGREAGAGPGRAAPTGRGRCNKRPRRRSGGRGRRGRGGGAASRGGAAGGREPGRGRAAGEGGCPARAGRRGRRDAAPRLGGGAGAGGWRPGAARLSRPWPKVKRRRKSLLGSARRARPGAGSHGPDSTARAAPRAPPQVSGAARPSRSHAPAAQRGGAPTPGAPRLRRPRPGSVRAVPAAATAAAPEPGGAARAGCARSGGRGTLRPEALGGRRRVGGRQPRGPLHSFPH